MRYTSNKETDTVRCTICGGLVNGKLQYSGDNYCKGHEQLNIGDVVCSDFDNQRSENHKHYYKPIAIPPLYGIIKHKWVCACGKEAILK